MKTVILGAGGQLSNALAKILPEALCLGVNDLDITDQAAVVSYPWTGTDVVINAAAYTNVDGAETPEGHQAAWAVNATAVANLTASANTHGFTLVHISTDYVFDGTATEPITEDAPMVPLSVYGTTKAAGDIAAGLANHYYLIRTSWVVGDGKNFVRIMEKLGAMNVSPTVVCDQIGRLTFTTELAEAIVHLVSSKAPYGTYNVTGGGEPASWAEVAREVFTISGYQGLSVTDQSTADYFASKPQAAPRPLYSVLDLAKIEATGFSPQDWRISLKSYLSGTATATDKS